MAKIDQKKKNMILIGIMVLIVVVTLYIVLKDDSGNDVTTVEDSIFSSNDVVPVPKGLDENIFQSDDFKRLQDFSSGELNIEERGRVNPFEPFQVSIE